MFSQCPECLTRFRVTAAALRAAQGTVRCGCCGSAFDALQSLSDTLPDEPDAATPFAPVVDEFGMDLADDGGSANDPIVTEFHFSADDIEQVFSEARDWNRHFDDAAVNAAEANGVGREPRAPLTADQFDLDEGESIEGITLEGERIVIDGRPELDDDLREFGAEDELHDGLDDAIPLDHDAAPLASDVDTAPVDLDSTDRFEALSDVPDSLYPERDEDDASGPAGATDEASTSPSVPAMLDEEPPQPSPFTPFRLRERRHALDDSLDPPAAGTPDNSRAMGIGALVLALLLLGQLVHHNRESLARRAGLGSLVRSVYSGFGHPLGPNWDLAGFELRQWGSKEPAPSGRGVMTVRTSIRNGAEFAQPMPLLRVELEDRFGNAVARRDFQPTEYLKDPAQAARLLEPGGKAEADLVLVDVSDEAVGYRLDVCLPDDAGAMLCAQSAAPGAPAP